MKRAICAAFLGLMLANADVSFADDGPSYEATVSFITKYTTGTFEGQTRQEIGFPSICNMEMILAYYNKGKITNYSITKLNLADLDAHTIKTHFDQYITINTYDNLENVTYEAHTPSSSIGFENEKSVPGTKCGENECLKITMQDGTSGIYILRPEQYKVRVSAAFAHLIKLCGGKDEPF